MSITVISHKIDKIHNTVKSAFASIASGQVKKGESPSTVLHISDRITAQVNGLIQGNRNTSDAIALTQTMDGALDEVGNMLQRMRSLAVQASNGILSDSDREAIAKEMTSLQEEIDRISEDTTFGGKQIVNGNTSSDENLFQNSDSVTIQVGANAGDTIEIGAVDTSFDVLYGEQKVDVSDADMAQQTISRLDGALNVLQGYRTGLGAAQERMDSIIRGSRPDNQVQSLFIKGSVLARIQQGIRQNLALELLS